METRDPHDGETPRSRADARVPEGARSFRYASSAGPGGQNVNKRATKCLMWVEVGMLRLSPAQRARLVALAGPALLVRSETPTQAPATTIDDPDAPASDPYAGVRLLMTSDEHRSQERNREACVQRLRDLLLRCLVTPKQRKATKPSKASKRRRVDEKVRRGSIKKNRTWRDE